MTKKSKKSKKNDDDGDDNDSPSAEGPVRNAREHGVHEEDGEGRYSRNVYISAATEWLFANT